VKVRRKSLRGVVRVACSAWRAARGEFPARGACNASQIVANASQRRQKVSNSWSSRWQSLHGIARCGAGRACCAPWCRACPVCARLRRRKAGSGRRALHLLDPAALQPFHELARAAARGAAHDDSPASPAKLWVEPLPQRRVLVGARVRPRHDSADVPEQAAGEA